MKRYYSLKELYRKYSIFLRKKISVNNPAEYNRAAMSVRKYLEWLKEKSLTIYAAGSSEITAFLLALLSIRNKHNRLYQRQRLFRWVKDIFVFYQWLVECDLMEENPFTEGLKQEIQEKIKSRDAPVEIPLITQQVPEAFKAVFTLANKMEETRGYHEATVRSHSKGWLLLFEWLVCQGISSIDAVTEKELIDYQSYLLHYKDKKTGRGLTPIVRLRHLVAVKNLFNHLRLALVIKNDPTHVIELPKCTGGVPRVLMSCHEVEKLLALPDTTSSVGLRDRTMMEVFYSSGLRLNELCHLKLDDIVFQEGMVRVMQPKGGVAFQRVVPIGEVALQWVKKYMNEARPQLLGSHEHDNLFVHAKGGPLHKWNVFVLMKNYRLYGGFKKQITSHSFRVTCATEMLRNRADIRYVQAQLGHKMIQSTQLYARVLPTDLKKVHQRTHPRERRRLVPTETSL